MEYFLHVVKWRYLKLGAALLLTAMLLGCQALGDNHQASTASTVSKVPKSELTITPVVSPSIAPLSGSSIPNETSTPESAPFAIPELSIKVGNENNTKITAMSVLGNITKFAVAFEQGYEVYTIDDSGTPMTSKQILHNTANMAITAISLDRTGMVLAIGSNNGDVSLVDLGSGNIIRLFSKSNIPITDLKFSPGTHLLAIGVADGTVAIWNTQAKIQEFTLDTTTPGSKGGVTKVAWSPDARFLAAASFDGSLTVWMLGNSKPILQYRMKQPTSGEGGYSESGAFSVAWSPNNNLLAVGGRDDQIVILDMAQSGKELQILVDDRFIEKDDLAWSPNGRSIVVASSGPLKIWDLAEKTPKLLAGHKGPVTSVTWSTNGQFIVSGGWDGQVIVWRIR